MAAVAVAMALHGFNDVFVIDLRNLEIGSFVTPTAMLVAYLPLKHNARRLVPPDNVERVSRWCPVASRRPAKR